MICTCEVVMMMKSQHFHLSFSSSSSSSPSPPFHIPTYFKPSKTFFIKSSSTSPDNKPKLTTHRRHHYHLLPLPLTLSTSLPSLALDSPPQQKINLEAIVLSIDDFFNRYPFFVTLIGVIWLVVIPLAQYYLGSYKYISALAAFQKLRHDPNAVLLDIRDDKSVAFLATPDLSLFGKTALQLHFNNDDAQDRDHMVFVNKVLDKVKVPSSTAVCVIDNFDGSSLKVAELLVKNGFKEAYAIKGGVRGKRGWQEIQEDVFPPSVHVYPRKKVNGSNQNKSKENFENIGNGSLLPDNGSIISDPSNGSMKKSYDSASQIKRGFRSSSPYPNYPDLKPPSSPTPLKPRS